jgi:hypothetical protein
MGTLTSTITPSLNHSPTDTGRTVTVYTPNGVETGTVLALAELNRLAFWLCQVAEYCSVLPYTGSRAEDDRWEREREDNGGYCDHCRDFAGKLLSEFALAPREVTQ